MPRIAAASSSSAHARPPLREAKRHLLTAVGRFAIFRPFREAPAVNEDDLRVLIRDQFLGGDSSVPIPADLDLVAAGICDRGVPAARDNGRDLCRRVRAGTQLEGTAAGGKERWRGSRDSRRLRAGGGRRARGSGGGWAGGRPDRAPLDPAASCGRGGRHRRRRPDSGRLPVPASRGTIRAAVTGTRRNSLECGNFP